MIIRNTLGNLPRWRWNDTFEELERMKQEMEKLYQYPAMKIFREPSAGVFPAINITEETDNYYVRAELPGIVFPAINITEETDNYYVRAELPGIKADDLELSIANNTLTIEGERKSDPEDENTKYHRREREAGRFSRKITLPAQIDASKADAKCNDGLLTIVMPKAESAKPKKITITAL
jgi:HSP20 family protein